MNKERHIGRFSVDRSLIERYPEEVEAMFEGLIVVRAEMMFDSNCIDYVALGDIFPLSEAFARAPEYRIEVVTKDVPEGRKVKAIKLKGIG